MQREFEPEQTERSDGTLSKSRTHNYNQIGHVSEEKTKYLFTFSVSCSLFLPVWQYWSMALVHEGLKAKNVERLKIFARKCKIENFLEKNFW